VRPAYPVGEVRAAEAALMGTLPEGTLMGRAAYGLARTCTALLGRTYGARVVLLVGTGDNGGDALFAGARLARRGARVDAILVGDRAHPSGLAALLRAGGRRVVLDPGHGTIGTIGTIGADAAVLVAEADLVLDGVVGIGGRGGLSEPVARLVEAVDRSAAWRVAVDLPSGVDADTGRVAGAAFTADVTVTFGTLKAGLLVSPGQAVCGVVELVDIGLGPWLAAGSLVPGGAAPSLGSVETADVAALWPVPGPSDDKYTRGVVGVAAGSAMYPGAAVLCVGAAIKAGAGMVRYEGAAAPAVLSRWPEAVVGQGRVQAWVVGPGLGGGPDAGERVRAALDTDLPVVVDADGLTALAAHPEWVRARAERAAVTVLTPHDREFERFGQPVGDDRVAAARRLAASLGATVLLKGSSTVVAHPDGTARVNPTGTAWLATAGTGDVLAGITGTLLAAGLGREAPSCAAFVHGLAARLAASGAPAAALDVVGAVPAAVAAILAAGPGDAPGPATGRRHRPGADPRGRIAR
jgi:ADP-dependent NAD(P)H-hydrate dehydratase / NAD(P)H-hydrate epimerase